MTRKDYQLIARVIAGLGMDGESQAWIARAFAEALADENERFNAERFLDACEDRP